ncbi:MAG: glycosyltransferase family 2 protein [Verrucomicrobia bacterium]|nr:glycosyltransferase family 2 protein [Verrucomicrobiota bacterium]
MSFVIPTLNAGRLLSGCLASIRAQDVDPGCVEILIADGGSKDATAAIAARHGARMVDAAGLMAEAAKRRAFDSSRARYIALLDADNEIVGATWLSRALAALDRHPEALGFESYYLKSPAHTALNRYLTSCLQISDPYARFLAGRLRLVVREADGLEVHELPADGSYPTGANGFVFRRELAERLPQGDAYHEAVFFPALMREGMRTLLKIRGCGVLHHYVTTWGDYYRKRQRAMIIRGLRLEESTATWDAGGRGRKLAALLYFGTALGPAIEGLARAAASRDPDWLLHPLAGLVSTAGNALGLLRSHFHPDRSARERLTKDLHDRTRR